MRKQDLIEELARKFEQADTACYGWTAEQFEIWWTKDSCSLASRKRQRERARIAYDHIITDGPMSIMDD